MLAALTPLAGDSTLRLLGGESPWLQIAVSAATALLEPVATEFAAKGLGVLGQHLGYKLAVPTAGWQVNPHYTVAFTFLGGWWVGLARGLFHLCASLIAACLACIRALCGGAWLSGRCAYRLLRQSPRERTRVLTAGRDSMEAGVFVVVRRANQWDEMMLAVSMGSGEWLCYTVTDAADRFMWVAVKLTIGNFRVMSTRAADREPPLGVDGDSVNWFMDPADQYLATKWAPADAGALAQLVQEGEAIAELVRDEPSTTDIFRAGSAGAQIKEVGTVAMPVVAGQVVGGGVGPPVLPLAGAAAAPAPATAAGKEVQVGDDLETLIKAVADLRLQMTDGDKSDRSKEKGRKDKKDRRRSHRRGSGSRSSSRSHRSHSSRRSPSDRKKKKKKKKRSRSRSSSSSSRGRYVRWRAHGKCRKVTPTEMSKADTKNFKKRVDLLTFAQEFPGALTAHFCNAVRTAMAAGEAMRARYLSEVPFVRYVTSADYGHRYEGQARCTETRDCDAHGEQRRPRGSTRGRGDEITGLARSEGLEGQGGDKGSSVHCQARLRRSPLGLVR